MSGQTKRFGKKRIQEMGGCEGAQFTFTDFGRVAPKDPSGQTPKKQLANFSRGRHSFWAYGNHFFVQPNNEK